MAPEDIPKIENKDATLSNEEGPKQLTEEQQKALEEIKNYFRRENIEWLIKSLHRNKDHLELPEFQELAKEIFAGLIKRRLRSKKDVDAIMEFKNTLEWPDEVFSDPNIKSALAESYVICVSNRSDLEDYFRESLNVPEEFFSSVEVRDAVKRVFVYSLKANHTYDGWSFGRLTDNVFKFLPQHKDLLDDPEIQEAAKESTLYMLRNKDDIGWAIQVKTDFALGEDRIKDPEIQKAAFESFTKLAQGVMTKKNREGLILLKEHFLLEDQTCWPLLPDLIAAQLEYSFGLDEAIALNKAFRLPLDLIYSEKIKAATRNLLKKELGSPRFSLQTVSLLKENFDPSGLISSEPEIGVLVMRRFSECFEPYQGYGWGEEAQKEEQTKLEKASTLYRLFNPEGAREKVKESIIKDLEGGYDKRAFRIAQEFHLTEQEISSPEIKEAAFKAISSHFDNYNRDNSVFRVVQNFSLSKEECWPIILKRLGETFFSSSDYNASDYRINEIIKFFGMPEDSFRKAAIISVIHQIGMGFIEGIKAIIQRGNLTETDLASPEIQEALEDSFVKILAHREDYVEILMEIFHLSPADIEPLINSALESYDPSDEYNHSEDILNPVLPFGLWSRLEKIGQISSELKEKIWNKILAYVENEPFLRDRWETGERLLGKQRWLNVVKNNKSLWSGNRSNSVHDKLLFLEKIESLPPEDQMKIARLVLIPVLNADFYEFKDLNEAIGYFDVNLYLEKYGNEAPSFKNFGEFFREARLQKENLQIPAHASENFKDAIGHLMTISGVDVPFLRKMVNLYSGEAVEEKPEDVEEFYDEDLPRPRDEVKFAQALIRIIEGEDPINERKTIKPWQEIFPLDPVHRLVFTAVGVHSLNRLTPKLQEGLKPDSFLGGILSVLKRINKRFVEQVSADYDQKIKEDPGKRNRYLADRDKRIKRDSFLNFAPGGEIRGINNFEEGRWEVVLGVENQDEITQFLREMLDDKEGRLLIFQVLSELASKKEALAECVDLAPFSEALTTSAENLVNQYGEDEILSLESQKFLESFSGHEVSLAGYLIYLALNNRRRQSESKQFKKAIDAIVGQREYVATLKRFKEEGYVGEKDDCFTAYVQGKLSLRAEDENAVKDILEKYGYTEVGRELIAEIAPGSDFRAWTCGDETDCCMPFTSYKNEEYILRDDTAYFLVKVINTDGAESIIAQSVLVEAEDKTGRYDKVIALDNIEVSNRAVHLRPMIGEAYERLKRQLIGRYAGQKIKIIIGTSYNDDGGIITGNLPLENIDYSPRQGQLIYSDCFSHSAAYTYYDSLEEQSRLRLYGVQKDLFEKSKIHELIKSGEEREEVEKMLEKISRGEDDNDGGLIFPDNFSSLIFDYERGESVGYIIAADYITDEEEPNSVVFESIKFRESVKLEDMLAYLKEYLNMKKIGRGQRSSLIDNLIFTRKVLEEEPELADWLKQWYGQRRVSYNNGELVVAL